MTDLVLKGGRVIDPSQDIDRVTDVAFANGKVAAIGDNLQGPAKDVTGLIVTPGLIDLHTHVYWGGTSLGVDADAYGRQSAVTTCVDTGSAGPGNFPGFQTHVIAKSQTRILAYLNISFAGIYGFSGTISVGEAQDMRLMAVREAAQVARDNRDSIIGIKVRIGKHAGGTSGLAPLHLALDAADQCGLPLMCHIDEAPPTYSETLDLLRPGDILTHCFRPFPNAPVVQDGTIRQSVHTARARGVLFDIGHGMGSFSWTTARAMLAAGFAPDTVSSDVHALCIHGPAWDVLRTMTKFLTLGQSLPQIITATTLAPAKALRRPDLGTLQPGSTGDASILDLTNTPIVLEDVLGETLTHPQNLTAKGRVLAGIWHD
ncbi:MAG: amidohydrolase/deacetylase family metallohydrolase [Pseudorhodobacter sp.]|nr:amidohydrolase/deacetylase family metallohydrolase [Pseudorhodobacter sp.]